MLIFRSYDIKRGAVLILYRVNAESCTVLKAPRKDGSEAAFLVFSDFRIKGMQMRR